MELFKKIKTKVTFSYIITLLKEHLSKENHEMYNHPRNKNKIYHKKLITLI